MVIQVIITQELYKQDTPEVPRFTNWLCELIQAIGTFSKGFPLCVNKVNAISAKHYTRALQLILASLRSIPNQPSLRTKSMFFMHRMMQCLGINIFEYLPTIINLFMVDCGIQDLIQFVVLINQLLSTFKEKVGEVIDKLLLPFITKIFQIFNMAKSQITPNSEEEREVLELKRHYYQFLNVIVSNNLSHVLISSTNIGQFNEVLQTLLDGCRFFVDPNIQKLSFGILRRLVQLWAGSNEHFTNYVVDVMVRVAFEVPWDTRFNLADGISVNILLVEISSLVLEIYGKSGAPFAEFLSKVFLPSINCPIDFIQGYMILLMDPKPNPRHVRTHVRSYLQKIR